MVVTMQNSIPFWYFEKLGGPLHGTRLTSIDPTGTLLEIISAARVIGCVVYPASELIVPGVIHAYRGRSLPGGRTRGCDQ